jgi:hypothetical protein
MKKIGLTSLLVLFTSMLSLAQSFDNWKRDPRWSAILSGGFSSYYGDLNNPGDIFDLSGNFNLGVQYVVRDHINIRAQLGYLRFSGSDENLDPELITRTRNLSFESNNWELSTLAIAELFPRSRKYNPRPPINPYAILGIGLLLSTPKATALSDGKTYKLRPLQTEGVSYSPVILAIPFGLGVNLYHNRIFNIGLEGIYRLTFSDYIDDVSDVYIDNDSFTNPIAAELADRRQDLGFPPAPEGTQRGNPDQNDGYFTMTVKIEYFIPPELLNNRRRGRSGKRVKSSKRRRRR